jgi:hypothetical protein
MMLNRVRYYGLMHRCEVEHGTGVGKFLSSHSVAYSNDRVVGAETGQFTFCG